MTPVFVYYFALDSFEGKIIGSVLFLIASLTDWYDGFIARKLGVVSHFGQFADPLADKVLVLSALFLFVWLNFVSWWMVALIAVRDVFLTVLRMYAIKKGMPIVTHKVAKWKTAVQMTFIFAVIIFYSVISYFFPVIPDRFLYYLPVQISLFVLTLITIYSLVVYVKENSELVVKFFKEFV